MSAAQADMLDAHLWVLLHTGRSTPTGKSTPTSAETPESWRVTVTAREKELGLLGCTALGLLPPCILVTSLEHSTVLG